MPTFRSAEVTEVLSRRTGLQRLAVRMADGGEARAYALTELTGDARVGDTVICNTTAVERSLGTGGWHVVHWNTTRSELVAPGPDHIMKLRYTSLQADIGSSELLHPEAADRELAGTPVIVCTLHSQVAAVAVGFAHGAPGRRLAYVMTDGAALPLALSDLVADLMQRKLLVGSVTAGHAFGGDLEAVTPASASGWRPTSWMPMRSCSQWGRVSSVQVRPSAPRPSRLPGCSTSRNDGGVGLCCVCGPPRATNVADTRASRTTSAPSWNSAAAGRPHPRCPRRCPS